MQRQINKFAAFNDIVSYVRTLSAEDYVNFIKNHVALIQETINADKTLDFQTVGEWLRAEYNDFNKLANLLYHVTPKNGEAFLGYLGRDWLRSQIDALGIKSFSAEFQKTHRYENIAYTLKFLDGNDKWLRTKIVTGRDLANVLNAITGRYDAIDEIKQRWYNFLTRHLEPGWELRFLRRSPNLKELIDEWVEDHGPVEDTLRVFLERYLDKTTFDYQRMLGVLNFHTEKMKSDSPVRFALIEKSLSFVKSFNSYECYDIILRRSNFHSVLNEVNTYDDKYFYRALIYALANAIQHKTGLTLFDKHREYMITEAKSLMKLIEVIDSEKLSKVLESEANLPGIKHEEVAALSRCYRASFSDSASTRAALRSKDACCAVS